MIESSGMGWKYVLNSQGLVLVIKNRKFDKIVWVLVFGVKKG
ncbi:MAG: hypothetical protein ACK518_03650 [bacterium]